MNTIHNVLTLIGIQLNQYAKLCILIGDLLDKEQDEKLKDYYLSNLKNAYLDYKKTSEKLVTCLDSYFKEAEETGAEVNLNYKKIYNELKKP